MGRKKKNSGRVLMPYHTSRMFNEARVLLLGEENIHQKMYNKLYDFGLRNVDNLMRVSAWTRGAERVPRNVIDACNVMLIKEGFAGWSEEEIRTALERDDVLYEGGRRVMRARKAVKLKPGEAVKAQLGLVLDDGTIKKRKRRSGFTGDVR